MSPGAEIDCLVGPLCVIERAQQRAGSGTSRTLPSAPITIAGG